MAWKECQQLACLFTELLCALRVKALGVEATVLLLLEKCLQMLIVLLSLTGLTVLLRSPQEASHLIIELLMITSKLFCSFWHWKEKYFVSLRGFVRDPIKLL